MPIRPIALTLTLLATLGVASAQNPPAAADPLAAIRSRSDLNDQDRQAIQTFVSQNVAAIASGDAAQGSEGVRALRAGYEGSEAFRRVYAAAALEAIQPAIRKAELSAAARLLTVVNAFNVPEAVPLLLDALTDERVGVRAAALTGLVRLRETVARAGTDTYARVLDALKTAGARETSRDTLRTLYHALDYSGINGAPDPRRNATALLELLEARARLYAAGEVPAFGADDAGLRLAGVLGKNLDDAERKRLTTAIAGMLKYALEQYVQGPRKLANVRDSHPNRRLIEERDAVERLVLVGEERLVALLAPSDVPQVANNLRRLELINVKNEWKKWVALVQTATGTDFALVEPREPESTPTTRPVRR